LQLTLKIFATIGSTFKLLVIPITLM